MGTNKKKILYFTLGFGKYKTTISHSENCLPELEIQSDISKFSGFCKRVRSISIYFTFNSYFASIYIREDPIIGNPVDFILESEDEVVREAVSHKLDRPLVNPSKIIGDNQLKLNLQLQPYRLVTL